jgi:hypothetical protein
MKSDATDSSALIYSCPYLTLNQLRFEQKETKETKYANAADLSHLFAVFAFFCSTFLPLS